mgnify:FL=1
MTSAEICMALNMVSSVPIYVINSIILDAALVTTAWVHEAIGEKFIDLVKMIIVFVYQFFKQNVNHREHLFTQI